MAVSTTIYVQSVGGYSSTTGGPIRLEYQHEGTPFMDRTADNEYSPFVAITDKRLIVRIRLRDVKVVAPLGTKSDLTAVLRGKGGTPDNTVNITFTGMVFVGASPGEQGRAEGGSVTLVYEHESSNGTTVPIS